MHGRSRGRAAATHPARPWLPASTSEEGWTDGEVDSSCSGQPIHLWQFLKELLLKPHSYGRFIRWLNKEKGRFGQASVRLGGEGLERDDIFSGGTSAGGAGLRGRRGGALSAERGGARSGAGLQCEVQVARAEKEGFCRAEI